MKLISNLTVALKYRRPSSIDPFLTCIVSPSLLVLLAKMHRTGPLVDLCCRLERPFPPVQVCPKARSDAPPRSRCENL